MQQLEYWSVLPDKGCGWVLHFLAISLDTNFSKYNVYVYNRNILRSTLSFLKTLTSHLYRQQL